MIARLSGAFDFMVVTRDTDLKANKPYEGIISDSWNTLPDGTPVYYFSDHQLTWKNVSRLLLETKPDFIHLNSMYSWPFTVLPLLAAKRSGTGIRIIVGPRGMLSRGALAVKPLKKKLFISAAKTLGLFNNITWHASTEVEALEVKNTFGQDVHVRIAIDLAPPAVFDQVRRNKNAGEMSLFYLGRISPVKNLLGCLRALQQIPQGVTVLFDIYGPVEDPEYWQKCEAEIRRLPRHVVVSYKGNLPHEKLQETLGMYHFLFLLTSNENYGHAIVESLSLGCPVIISDRTPWRQLETARAGWDLALEDSDMITSTLAKAAAMDQSEYDSWSQGAFSKGKAISENRESIEAYNWLFS
jgi:glycosyltransferase involved in cell wall biosynthesis